MRADLKTEKQSRRKAEILAVAAKLFKKWGYEKTTLEMIGEGVGLTKQALYYYLPSKEAALFEVCRNSDVPTPAEHVLHLHEQGEGPVSVISQYIDVVIEQHLRDSVGLLARYLPSMSKELQRKIRRELTKELHALEMIVQSGCDQNLFRVKDPRLAARVLQNSVQAVSLWKISNRQEANAIAETYRNVLMSGLLSDDNPKRAS